MDKSYVAMENFICPICGKQHDLGAGVLLNTSLKEVFESNTVVIAYKPCQIHQDEMDSGLYGFILESTEPNLKGLTGRSIKMLVSDIDIVFAPEHAENFKSEKMCLMHPEAFEFLVSKVS